MGATALAVAASVGLAAQEDALTQKARGIHDRVMTLDTHADISAANFTAECNYTMDLGNQVNLPKMIKGGLDAAFFIVYVGQGELTPDGYASAYKQASEKFDAVHRLTEKIAPDKIGLALTSDDARRIYKSGRKVAFIGVENGYPIGEDIGRIKEFHDRGARYLSLAHNGHSQLSDSNTGEAQGFKWNGLSPLGKQAIAELNRVGIMIDISHPSIRLCPQRRPQPDGGCPARPPRQGPGPCPLGRQRPRRPDQPGGGRGDGRVGHRPVPRVPQAPDRRVRPAPPTWSSPWAAGMPARSIRASAMRTGSWRTRPASRSRSCAASATTSTPASSSCWPSWSPPAPNRLIASDWGGAMRLVVIGGSDAGISAGLRARELDPSVEVSLLVADGYPNFSICGLPYYLSGDVPDWRDLAHRTSADLEAAGLRAAA